ncbi:hypothetical protein, partial [Pseudomonas sp. BMS12]|uniref:hypothetical protein n=1 Tax=Pseudomonas sp. BMS12 TaxID=1796033 RepID=UPI00191BEA59
MKGLRKLALSCCFAACSMAVSATEISENLQQLDPLVYFPLERTFTNLGSTDAQLQYPQEEKPFSPSFLGEHAGQAMVMAGADALHLQTSFLSSDYLAGDEAVLGFFIEPDNSATQAQCLLSIGADFGLVLDNQALKVFEQGEVQADQGSLNGSSAAGLYLVFSQNRIDIYSGYEKKVWEHSLPEGLGSLLGEDIVLGDCAAAVKTAFGVADGFHGAIDEIVAVKYSAAAMPAGADFAAAGAIARKKLELAASGSYPVSFVAGSEAGKYRVDARILEGIVYPDDNLNLVEWSDRFCVAGTGEDEDSCQNFRPRFDQVSNDLLIQYLLLDDSEQGRGALEIECYGSAGDCEGFYQKIANGFAFGKPRVDSTEEFTWQKDELSENYDRALKQMSLQFSASLTDVDVSPKPLAEGVLRLYRLQGEDWSELPIGEVNALGYQIDVLFPQRLRDGTYRLVLSGELSSFSGGVLGSEQSYEFTVATSEFLVTSATSISAVDFAYDGQRLVVDGAVLTLAGTHDFESVTLKNSAVITSPAQQATRITADEVEVDASSKIDVSGRGKLSTSATVNYYGGGTHAGQGGAYSSYPLSPAPYGYLYEPRDFGAGGRSGSNTFDSRGAGALELQARVLRLDGKILAQGEVRAGYGSGAGGSLLIRVDELDLGDHALIDASGGGFGASGTFYSGGGGGRVALYYRDLGAGVLATQVVARGGLTNNANAQHGAAGTVYLHNEESGEAELIIDNSGVDSARAPLTRVDLGVDGALAAKLTVINANVELIGAKLGEMSLKDSTAKVQVGEI